MSPELDIRILTNLSYSNNVHNQNMTSLSQLKISRKKENCRSRSLAQLRLCNFLKKEPRKLSIVEIPTAWGLKYNFAS